MAQMFIYSIRDCKSGFLTPTCEINDEIAVRNFQHAVLSSESILQSFSKDFSLFKLASLDTDSGQVVPIWPVVHLAEASDALLAAAHASGGDV